MGRTVFRTGSAHAQCGLHAGLTGCIELSRYVGNEHHLAWRVAEELGDAAVARRGALGASRCVEVARKKRRAIACGSIGEEIAMGLRAPGREDRVVFACIAQACERGWHVGIDSAPSF